jgi:PAS domain S-box-containing protein
VRLALGALALLVAIVAVLGGWQVLSARSSQQREIESGEATAAHLASSALASALASRLELMTNLADQPELAKAFVSDHPSQLSQLAAALHLLYPGFSSFDVISGAGRVEGRWPSDPAAIGTDVSSTSFFKGVTGTGHQYVSGASQQTAPPRELVVGLAAPVRSRSGQIVGVLQGTLATSALGLTIGGVGLGNGGSLVIIDQAGHPLSGPAASATRSFKTMPLLAKALAGGTGSGTGDVPGYPGSRLVGYASVPTIGWAVLAEEPSSTLDSLLAGLTDRLLAIGLLILVLALGTAFLVGRLLRQLTREHEQTGAVLSSVGEGVATLDSSGRPVRVNPALERLGGRPACDMENRDWSEAFPLYDQRGDPITWEESIPAQAIRERSVVTTSGYELHLARSDGNRVPIAITAAPLVIADEIVGAVVVLRDISQEREVDQLKTSLVSTVSHELRTPLTMIQGFSELLLTRDDLGRERSRDALQQVHSSAQRLGRLIDDLLSVSRIESGKLTVEVAPVDLAAVISEVVASFEAQTGRRFVVELDSGLAQALGDRDKIVQVITNLVSNAVKYSPAPSSVEIVARSGDNYAEVSVIDHGIGMTEEEQSHVFEKFTRADRPEVRKAGGTGLGLYISKSLVEIQRGQLWVRSTPEGGSTFSLSLPLAGASALPASNGDDKQRRTLEDALDR